MLVCNSGTLITAFVLCVTAAKSASKTRKPCEVMVRIESGPVCGLVLDAGNGTKYYSFRGVPYGKPPVGARRFQELEPLEPWNEPLYAILEGPACPQKNLLYGHIPVQIKSQSDDCIYANVHVPHSAGLDNNAKNWSSCRTKRKKTGLPILVSIHGGSFNVGSGNSDIHGPEYLIYKEIIVITFNYRLNVFGFLSLNSPKIPGNAGLRDMVTLLRWVQRNARAFGGDPDDVTLLGQSVGAASVHLLSMTTAAKGLFKRIIMLSGTGIPNFYDASPEYAKTLANMFLKAADINSTDPEFIHQKLINMPLHDIMYANNIVQYQTGLFTFVPVVERELPGVERILEDEPISLIAKGRGKDIPILVSYTSNDMEFSRWPLMYIDILSRIKADPLVMLPSRVVSETTTKEARRKADKVMRRYFDGEPNMDGYIASITDIYFKYPTYKLAEWRVALNGAPLFISEYSYESIFSVMKQGLWVEYKGAIHLEDLTYLFHVNSVLGPNVPYRRNNTDDQMKEWMTNLITNFMRCSNPTCKDAKVAPWPPVTREKLQYNNNSQPMVFRMTELTPEDQDLIQFYDSIDDEARNLSVKLKRRNLKSSG